MTHQPSYVRLPDGRLLGVAQYGDPCGMPVLYFHGCPGSRLEAALAASEACKLGLRIIGVDRPGCGLSSPCRYSGLGYWTRDVGELADQLMLTTFSVLGVSGGGPYALSCAANLPDRVNRVALACPVGQLHSDPLPKGLFPPLRLLLMLAKRKPGWIRPLLTIPARLLRSYPNQALCLLGLIAGGKDREVLSEPNIRLVIARSFQAGVLQGVDGVVQDIDVFVSSWDFSLQSINAPIHIWHGGKDRTLPKSMALTLKQELGKAALVIAGEEGHLSLPVDRMEEVLNWLASPYDRT